MNIGVVAPESHSHVAVASNVGVELARLGHAVTYFGFEDVREVPERAGLGFVAIAPHEYPRGSVGRILREVAESRGLASSLRTMRALGELLDCRLRHLPDLLRAERVDAVVADQISPAAGTVCDLVGIPFATICTAVHMNYDHALPPFFTPWSPGDGVARRARNRAGYAFFDLVRQPLRRRVNAVRRRAGLPAYRGPHAGMSRRCQITQLVRDVDFAYRTLPPHFHYAGPLFDVAAPQAGEWDPALADGRPLVYCSFGTVNNACRHLYETVLEAMAAVDAQLVMSLGGGDVALSTPPPSGAVVLPRAPQRRVLAQCDAFITHAGVSSALESLYHGVPMVCVPIANDQPGMAARLAHHGVAIARSSRRLSPARVAGAVRRVIDDAGYRDRARTLSAAVRAAPGAAGAARIIDTALR